MDNIENKTDNIVLTDDDIKRLREDVNKGYVARKQLLTFLTNLDSITD